MEAFWAGRFGEFAAQHRLQHLKPRLAGNLGGIGDTRAPASRLRAAAVRMCWSRTHREL
jgi:hypothetical protein